MLAGRPIREYYELVTHPITSYLFAAIPAALLAVGVTLVEGEELVYALPFGGILWVTIFGAGTFARRQSRRDAPELARLVTLGGFIAAMQLATLSLNQDNWVGLWLSLDLVLAFFIFRATRFWRRWVFWRTYPTQRPTFVVTETVLALFILVLVYTLGTALLIREGVVDTTEAAGPLVETEVVFLWYLLDAIPVLKVPETVNWKTLDYSLSGTAGGLVVLSFKILVILPVAAAITQVVRQSR